MSNKMGSKLADSMRSARNKPRSSKGAAEKKTTAASAKSPATAKAKSSSRQASQPPADEQSPAPNLDHPWDNLHPTRIWPD